MSTALVSHIRGKLDDYLSGRESLRSIREWLAPISWDIEEKGDSDAMKLVYQVELCLAEHANGDWTDDELRARLRSLTEADQSIPAA